MNQPRLTAYVAVAMIAVAAACAPTQVAINARFPANYPQAAQLTKIAVAPFEGRSAQNFTGALRSEIAGAVFDGKPHFTVLSGLRGATPQAGQAIGAQAILSGSVTVGSGQDNFLEGRRVCSAENEKRKCVRWREYQVSCSRRTLTVTVNPLLTNVADASQVYSAQKTANRTSRWCSDRARTTTDDAMVTEMFSGIAVEIRRDIAPYNAVLNATVKETKDGLARDQAAQFDQAVAAAKAGNFSSACENWRAINSARADHMATVYNLGICKEATGDFAGALADYERARTIGAAADRTVTDSVARVKRLLGAEGQLAAEEEARAAAAAEAAARQAEQARLAEAKAKRAAEAAAAKTEQAAEDARRAEAARAAKRAELVARHGAAFAAAIEAGAVSAGMSPQQVIEARGQPDAKEIITPTEEIWRYGGERVMFANGRVTFVRR